MFFETESPSNCRPCFESGKIGLIHVIDGSLSVAQIVGQLQRLVQHDFNWMVNDLGDDTFRVEFPTKDDLYISLTGFRNF